LFKSNGIKLWNERPFEVQFIQQKHIFKKTFQNIFKVKVNLYVVFLFI